jgi:hypothetical protein
MKKKFGKILFIPVVGLLAFNISCSTTTDPNVPVAVYGCMDPQSINYNPRATIDDKSCLYAKSEEQAANAVIEVYSGVRSKHGPEAQLMVNNILASSPDVVVINVHAGADAIAKISWPDYTSKFGQALADTAGMNQTMVSYPAGSVNRYHFADVTSVSPKKMLSGEAYTVLYKDGFLPAANYWNAKVTPVNIGFASYWTATPRKLKVLVELYYKSAETVPNYINVALLENKIVGKQLLLNDSVQTDYEHNHVLRYLLTGQWGELVTGTTAGARIKKTYEYTVPSGFTIENCDLAVFVSRVVGGKQSVILTGKKAKVKI